MKNTYEKIIKDTAHLLGSALVGRVFSSIAGIVTARVLGPSDYGLLRIINYVPSLEKFGGFGFGSVAKREIAHVRGSKTDSKKEIKIKDVAFSSDILWSIILTIIILIISFQFERVEIKIGLWIVSITLLIRAIVKLFVISLTLEKRFSSIAFVSLVSTIVSSCIILSTIYWGGIYSVLLSGLAASFFSLLYYKTKIDLNFKFSIIKDEFLRQLKIAIPLAGGTVALGIFGWTQRIQVSTLFGLEALGFYMLIAFLIQSIYLLNNTFSRASSIELYERLGDKDGNTELRPLIIKPSMVLGLLLGFIGAIIWICGPLLINIFLPNYKPAQVMIPYIIPIIVFDGISAMPRVAMNSAKLNMQLITVFIRLFSILCFAVITYFVGYKLYYGLKGVIWARTFAALIMFIGSYIATGKYIFNSLRDMLGTILQILIPSILVMLICTLLTSLIGTDTLSKVSLCMLLFFFLISPVLVVYEKKLQLIRLLKTIIK